MSSDQWSLLLTGFYGDVFGDVFFFSDNKSSVNVSNKCSTE